MPVDPSLLEISAYTDPGFRPLVDHGAWRVAVLNYIDHLDPPHLKDMHRHHDTDEVFVLLTGRCILFLGENEPGGNIGAIEAVDMEPLHLYNVKRDAWHTHTLTPGTSVLVIENRNTSDANSSRAPLAAKQTAHIVAAAECLWGDIPD